MPNWVTTKIKSSPQVIQALVNEQGHVDFSRIIKFEGSFEWDGVRVSAETLAEKVVNAELSDHPLLRPLEEYNRARASLKDLDDEGFEQFVQMLRNHRATGYFHTMDFAREAWGTKWNACDSTHDVDAGTARFDTAWSFPAPVMLKLSEAFPGDEIAIEYADEDIGSNCGRMTLKAGAVVEQDIAGSWRDMSDADRERWSAFAYQVKGWDPEEDEGGD